MPVPASALFTFHWYVGVLPPWVGIAVYVTDVPAHIAPALLSVTLTAGTAIGVTVMVIVALIAVSGVAHVALLVSTHVTISPFAGT